MVCAKKAASALVWTLAGVLLTAGSNATFQAPALATTGGLQCVAWQGLWTGSALAVCFGNDLVAHGTSLEKVVEKLLLGHRLAWLPKSGA